MKPGAEYEEFAYKKFDRLFADAKVVKNDKITGKVSGLEREIDVSVRIPWKNSELLYIVQCKDWARKPADIRVLGEFASVMEDVGATKGFVLCTAGFARTNHQYASKKGIELVTIEDIQSTRWHTDVEIPLVFSIKEYQFLADMEITANEALVEANRFRAVSLPDSNTAAVRKARNRPELTLGDYVQSMIEAPDSDAVLGTPLDLSHPGLEIQIGNIWVPLTRFYCSVWVKKRTYLKYFKPDEYSQLTDHVRSTTLPLQVKISQLPLKIDDTFIELDDGFPGVPGLWLETEQWTQIEQNSGIGPLSQ